MVMWLCHFIRSFYCKFYPEISCSYSIYRGCPEHWINTSIHSLSSILCPMRRQSIYSGLAGDAYFHRETLRTDQFDVSHTRLACFPAWKAFCVPLAPCKYNRNLVGRTSVHTRISPCKLARKYFFSAVSGIRTSGDSVGNSDVIMGGKGRCYNSMTQPLPKHLAQPPHHQWLTTLRPRHHPSRYCSPLIAERYSSFLWVQEI